jgi:hypothetical protein
MSPWFVVLEVPRYTMHEILSTIDILTRMHKLLSKNLAEGTGTCQVCGEVPLYWKSIGDGKRSPRCSVAWSAQRNSPNRHNGIQPHGFTSKEARELKKGASCALCGHDDESHLVVDHCHESLDPRDILCQHCNSGLGFFRDNPQLLRAGADYLEKHKNSLP